MPKGITTQTQRRKDLIYQWAEENQPVTVRQMFYRLSTLDALRKTENGYKAVGRLCTQMRRAGEIPFQWFADNTRWMRRPRTYNTIKDALQETAYNYRKSLWQEQNGLLEIWLEKEALAGVIYPTTAEWDVPLMVVKGYPSVSFMHAAAQQIARASERGRRNHIFYFGDRDPSGMDIYRHIGEELTEFAPKASIEMKHVAVTEAQVKEWNLPSRPTKRTDSRAKNWEGDSVELDAIHPEMLRQLVRDCISSVIDYHQLKRVLEIERMEKESVPELLQRIGEK